MANRSVDSNDEYKGPSRIGNAFTKGFTLGGLTSLISLPMGLHKTAKNFFVILNSDMHIEESVLRGAVKNAARPLWIGMGAGVVSFLGGSVWGWTQSAKSQRQHEELVTERNGLQQEVTGLRDSHEKAQVALNGWAEKTGKSPDASFADKAASSVDTGPRAVG